MLEDKLPNKSEVHIEIRTNFKPQIEDGEDWRTEAIKNFHNAIHYIIEKYLTDNDKLENSVLEILNDRDELPKGVKEFSDLGGISISISQIDVKCLQKDLDDDEIKIHLSGKKIVLHKDQTKLKEGKL